jgi:rhamnosyltransferase
MILDKPGSVPYPRVAVLMAAYNGEKHIREQIDSILAQEQVEVYLYIRDDRSSDGTIAVISEYTAKYHNIVLLPHMPQQLRATKNFYSIVRDIDLQEIDYMAYSDQDDVWLPGKLAAAAQAIMNHKVDCYASNLVMGNANAETISGKSVPARLLGYFMNRKSNRQTEFDHYFEAASAGCTLVLTKEVALYFQQRIRRIYDELPSDASHDWSTYAITRLKGFRWYIDSESYIIYRQHAENAYGANLGIGGIAKLIDLFRSGWYKKHILMIEDLYNEGDVHPSFIETIKGYRISSFFSRWKVAIAISRYRRKWVHRILLFLLVLLGYFK